MDPFTARELLLKSLVNTLLHACTLPDYVEEALLRNIEELCAVVENFNKLSAEIQRVADSR